MSERYNDADMDSWSFLEWLARWRGTEFSDDAEDQRKKWQGIGLEKGQGWRRDVVRRLRGQQRNKGSADGAFPECSSLDWQALDNIVHGVVHNVGYRVLFGLEQGSPAIQADKEVVLVAVGCIGGTLRNASEVLRGDKEVVLVAVENTGDALEHASQELRSDREVVLAAAPRMQTASAMLAVDATLLSDRAFVLELASAGCRFALSHVGRSLQSDRQFVLEAVQRNGLVLADADPELRDDEEVVREAVSQHSSCLQWASEKLVRNEEILLLASRTSRGPGDIKRVSEYKEQAGLADTKHFDQAVDCKVGVRGEKGLPIVNVALTGPSFAVADRAEGKDKQPDEQRKDKGNDKEEEAAGNHKEKEEEKATAAAAAAKAAASFRCEVSLLSGTHFAFDLLKVEDGEEVGLPGPTIGDLAAAIVEKLPQHIEGATRPERVFLNILMDDDSRLVSPFDWDRQLGDFVSGNS